MNDTINDRINLREIMQLCRNAIDEINENSIVAVLRVQNEHFEKALELIERILPRAERMLNQDNDDIGIRAATMFIIGLWSRIRQGGSVADLNRADWYDLFGIVYEKTADIDPKDYSLLVFDLYKRSIAYSIEPMRYSASQSTIKRLEEIVSLMEEYAENLDSGDMPEVDFIEENLWLSLEAIFLVITDRMNYLLLPGERRELAEAVKTLLFQKFRYSLYEKEQAAIDACLEHQKNLDQKLTKQVNAYVDALRDELDEFDMMVERAFSTTDFREAFRGSIALGKHLGAEELLLNKHDVDEYFMS